MADLRHLYEKYQGSPDLETQLSSRCIFILIAVMYLGDEQRIQELFDAMRTAAAAELQILDDKTSNEN